METNLAPNPYQAPRAELGPGDGAPASGAMLTDEEIATFVGDAAAYYQKKWARANRTGGFYAGFNFAALIVSTLWLLYRRMYLAFVAFLGLQLLVPLIGGVMLAGLSLNKAGTVEAVLVAMLLTKVGLAFVANGLYLRRARREVEEARQGGPTNLPFLRTRGGTSSTAVAIGIAVNLLVTLLGR